MYEGAGKMYPSNMYSIKSSMCYPSNLLAQVQSIKNLVTQTRDSDEHKIEYYYINNKKKFRSKNLEENSNSTTCKKNS